MIKLGIYKIISTIKPDRFYIGSSNNLDRRIKKHLYELKIQKHHSSKMQRHVNKYGIDDLKIEIIEYCELEKLIDREQFYLDTLKPYFNTSTISVGCGGWKMTDEHKAILSKVHKGRIKSEEERRKISEGNKGHITSEETKIKLRQLKHSEETKKKISIAHKGRKLLEEHRQKIIANRAKQIPPMLGKKKLVIDLQTGIFYNSINEAGDSVGISYSAMWTRISKNNKRFIYA